MRSADRGWVLLTLDARLRYDRLERDAIMQHGLAAFVLVGGQSHVDKAEIFLEAHPRVLRFLQAQEPPFIPRSTPAENRPLAGLGDVAEALSAHIPQFGRTYKVPTRCPRNRD